MHRCIRLILTLVFASLAGTAVAGNQVTAEWNVDVPASSFGSFGGTGFSQARGQSFEATVTGRVETIELRIGRNSDHSEPIVIGLFDVDASDEPVGPALMTGEFPAADIPINVIVSPTVFAFENGATVTASQRYAVTFAPLNLDPDGSNYFVNGSSNEDATYGEGSALRSADAGATWIVETILDWGFRVVVDVATPVEATSWGRIKGVYR